MFGSVSPEQELQLSNQRIAELQERARAARLARRVGGGSATTRSARPVRRGLRVRFGLLIVEVGRVIAGQPA